ncbi:hypothetical protein JCM24511_01003 [Saitozyma sp. JCM 24511]|nr:hypothetical protein JCM24511_01003 [Saitozyma sp. JCM 24511]
MRVGHRVCSTCRILATARPSAGGGGSSAAHRPPLAPILRSSSSGPGGPRSEEVRAREAARARAWYLDNTPSNPSTRSTSSPSSGSSPIPPIRPEPRFTTYDPNRTTSTPSSSDPDLNPLIHLPTFAPDHLHPLHAFLVANELIEPGTVQFLHTPSSGVSGSDDSREVIVGDRGFEARWEWVGVCEVKGRGKGVVARAERSLRTWLRDNPVAKLSAPRAKPPRIEPDTDWALVPVGKDGGICVNLFTAEGRDRWALADLWRPAPAPAPQQ